MEVSEILKDRAKTHGAFKNVARLSFYLKDNFYKTKISKLTLTQQEAVNMILHKIARIGAGNPSEIDHWRDIAGYATLIVMELEDDSN